MTFRIVPVLSLLLVVAPAVAAHAVEKKVDNFAPMVLGNTELRPFHSDITGRGYLLYIGYPDSYNKDSKRKYPVVYVTDAYWNFIRFHAIGPSLWYDKVAPEYIIVGIGYEGEHVDYKVERMYELSPTKVDEGWVAEKGGRTGGSRKFLNAIKREIIPYVEANLPADPSFRVLAGASMGGLFSLYAMYEEPGLFQGVIATSPAVGWDHLWLRGRQSSLCDEATNGGENGTWALHTRLFMSVGDREDREFISNVVTFDQIMKHAQYSDFRYQFRFIDGERHGSVAESFTRGLRFVFAERASVRDFK